MSLYLVIDVGTSAMKTALYGRDGQLVGSRSASYPLQYPRQDWAEQDPRDWWQAACGCCRELLQDMPASGPIEAVSVSGQTPSCVPVDQQGNPLRPAILWLDRRAVPQVNWLRQQLGVTADDAVNGNRLDSYFGGLKWLWFRQNEEALYQNTWKIMQASGFITYQLTGQAAIDPGQAGLCSPFFNPRTGNWDEDMCRLADLDIDKLPPVHPSTAIIGQVTAQASAASGIPAGTPVICGAADFACACLSAGVVAPGTAAMMLGTAGNLLLPAMRRLDSRLLNTIYFDGRGLSLGGVMAGGSVNWFGEMLESTEPDLLGKLDAEAAQIPAGSDGLIFLPYLMGERTPVWDPQARGVYVGLSARQRRGHLYRAVLEGVAYAFRQIHEILLENGDPISEITVIDGGARSAVWRQILADILGVPIRWMPNCGGTPQGAAFLAAVGAGHASDFTEISAWLEPTLDLTPNPIHAKIYAARYRVYCGLYERLRDTFIELKDAPGEGGG